MDISFEKLQENDLEKVRSIYNYYVENTVNTLQLELSTRDDMRSIVFFKNPRYQTFAIHCDGTFCGYVLVTQYKKREGYKFSAEVTIYLHKDYRGKGIGKKAVCYIEEFAKKQGFHTLLAVISAENTSSCRLFESCGYEKCAYLKEVGRKFDRYADVAFYQKVLE